MAGVRVSVAAVCWAVAALWASGTAVHAQGVPLVDVHSHFQAGPERDFVAGLRQALVEMDAVGIRRTLLMPPPLPRDQGPMYYDIEDLRFAAQAHPDRVSLLGGSSLNVMLHHTPPDQVTDEVKTRFRARAEAILAQGAVGFGELAIHHVSIPAMGPNHAYERVPADHPLLLLLADIAAERDVPIDLHMDLVPETMPLPASLRRNVLNPDTLAENATEFRRLLGHNPKTRWVWSHVGFEPLLTRTPQEVRSWLQAHPNLFMSFRVNRGAPMPAAALNPKGQVKPDWVGLIQAFPDRFMLGSDSFYDQTGVARGGGEPGSNAGLKALRALIDALPAPLAQAVASGNAVRLYKLPPLSRP